MDEFINTLDIGRFESSNSLWNGLMLNDPWSVGYVTTLIEMEAFDDKEHWESYYYELGEKRNNEINKLSSELKEKLNNEQLVLTNKGEVYKMNWDFKNLNFNFGRTRQQLAKKGTILFQEAKNRGISISEEECIEAIRFRTICQTWNGIIIRERNTIKTLQKRFPKVDFISTEGDFDYKYAVDYELKYSGNLICGIQIKPKSYLGKAPYLRKAQSANARKNQDYKNEFGKPVFNVISKTNGDVINIEVLEQISKLIE